MTIINLHGILAREYGKHFSLELENPKHVLHAIDCSKNGFLRRIIELQRDGFVYDIIVNKKRIEVGKQMDGMTRPETIDLVPAIIGSGGAIAAIFMWFAEGSFLAQLATAVIFAAIAYALTPTPDVEALEVEAAATKGSFIFSNRVNVASQGAPVPVGYGRLKVGSQVVQATIRSYPLYTNPQGNLVEAFNTDSSAPLISNRIANEGGPDPDPDPDPDNNNGGYFLGHWMPDNLAGL